MLSLACHNYNKKAVKHILAATFLCQLNTTSGIREDREEESAFRSGKNPWYEIICQGHYLFDGKLYFMHYSGIFQFCISPVLNNGTIDLFIFRCKENLITPRSWRKKNCGYNPLIFFVPVLTFASVLHGRLFSCQLELNHFVTRVIF